VAIMKIRVPPRVGRYSSRPSTSTRIPSQLVTCSALSTERPCMLILIERSLPVGSKRDVRSNARTAKPRMRTDEPICRSDSRRRSSHPSSGTPGAPFPAPHCAFSFGSEGGGMVLASCFLSGVGALAAHPNARATTLAKAWVLISISRIISAFNARRRPREYVPRQTAIASRERA
jgi:hypothetical protein